MNRARRARIVATLGPASRAPGTVKALAQAGVDVFRLNFSHGSHDDHAAALKAVRGAEMALQRPLGVLADLQGPKLRLGRFKDVEIAVKPGHVMRFDLDPTPGDETRVQMPHPEIFKALREGMLLLLDDGRVRLRVGKRTDEWADVTVESGSKLSDRKGVAVPEAVIPVSALTPKDREDLAFALRMGVDWVALSFVQKPEDMAELKRIVNGQAACLAKIEKPAAVRAFSEILKVSDGIMVARGDLGVELPVHAVPPIQKRLVRACRQAATPVIVATQMLESMIESPMPTRAEVSDVATAIYEGADAIMLSAESAAGHFPVDAVRTMDAVARSVESDPVYREVIESSRSTANRTSVADSIAVAAREIAETTDIAAICAYTQSGTTVRLAARERPRVPIIAMSSQLNVLRQMALVWGAHCVLTPALERFRQAVVNAVVAAREFEFADASRQIIVIAGVPFNTAGSTNILRVAPCDERLIYRTDPE